ncbi:carboxymuconolactone decarboxylase family protein [Cellulomonas carbonis]|uniref:Transposase n=1 Tax=Cellulomonas carbonis T26 TaxID=947969 RepID=A0A0A0BRU6_9CELL|nr:carboxymuconolactone decarboxylase family protein [Cellulomonas carbonis]KGM11178.1 transposase [Cellulomonas carbonis T26]GGC12480.1 putative transposase fusion protein [Cellulomonas carbonis]
MARISPPSRITPLRRAALAVTRRLYGRALEPSAVAAHHGGVFWTGLVHESLVLASPHRLPASLRDLVTHRVAVVIGCPWCIDFGAMLALRAGLTVERLMAVPDYAASPLLTPLEKRALAYADALTATPPTVDDAQVEALRGELGEAGLVELTHLVALENHRSRFNHGLGLTAQGFTDAAVCALPGAAADDGASVAPGSQPG